MWTLWLVGPDYVRKRSGNYQQQNSRNSISNFVFLHSLPFARPLLASGLKTNPWTEIVQLSKKHRLTGGRLAHILSHMKHNTDKHLLPRAKFVKYDADTWELSVDGCPTAGDWVAAQRKCGRLIRFEITAVRITHQTQARTFSFCRFRRPQELK